MHHRIRVWDLPTRLFHWVLVLLVVGLVISGEIGGAAILWHARLGHAVLALLIFRLLWGVWGGHWSRFSTFVRGPVTIWRYLRGSGGPALGHNPLGALSVLALLLLLLSQVGTGLMSDDEIAFTGPLAQFVPGTVVSAATAWHKGWGKVLLLALIGLHISAVVFYMRVKKHNLVVAMLHGDQVSHAPQPASRDDLYSRLLGLLSLLCAAALALWVYRLM